MVAPQPLEPPFEAVDNPRAVDSVALNTIRLASSVVFNIGLLLAAASLVVRYVRARGEVRRQLMWMAIAAVVFVPLVVVAFIGAMTDSEAITNVAAAGMVVLLPVSAGLAVSRYHLYDVDRILSRAVTYVIVSTLLVGAYVAVVVVLAARIRSGREPVSDGDDARHARRRGCSTTRLHRGARRRRPPFPPTAI